MKKIDTVRARWLADHVLPHEPALRAWLGKRGVPGLEIDDVVQDTYAILASLDTVQHLRNPRNYMFQVAYSVIATYLRRSRIVSFRSISAMETFVATDVPSPERQVADREELYRLGEVIAQLPQKTRAIFMMRRVEGLSQKAIAARLHMPVSTVEKHISRGLRHIMDVFAHGGKDGGKDPACASEKEGQLD